MWPDRVDGSTGSARLDDAVRDDVRGLLDAGRNATLHYGVDGQRRGEGLDVFVESFAPPPRMIVFGAIDFAAAVAKIGTFLGFRVTVCDARPVFATASRFPGANEVVVEWPHRYLAAEAAAGRIDGRTVLCVLTHDPKFDVPLLEVALRLPEVAYIGAMGSRRTHDDRRERLLERGLTEAELARMCSPIGLDLGARTPEETAVSIAAEMIATHWGGAGARLADREGPIHGAFSPRCLPVRPGTVPPTGRVRLARPPGYRRGPAGGGQMTMSVLRGRACAPSRPGRTVPFAPGRPRRCGSVGDVVRFPAPAASGPGVPRTRGTGGQRGPRRRLRPVGALRAAPAAPAAAARCATPAARSC